MTKYKQQSLEPLVDYLMSLRDENLARRVQETSDVEWCLSELYDYLHADVANVVRCRDCKYITPVEGGLSLCCQHNIAVAYNDFCSCGERKEE